MTNVSKTGSVVGAQASPLELTVPDLAAAIEFFTGRLNFRLDMIMPADAPRTALISREGATIRLDEGESLAMDDAQTTDPETADLVISRVGAADVWRTGRAGMQYRDLIPGRMGGLVVSSHVRISEGGETPDYVHYHKVRFQMIFCRTGWARVVYEGQGPPFVLEPGDCVLQPPEIRHRVLESSAGLEVIEVGCPAVHETWTDHELELPTRKDKGDQLFSGQRFVRHRASEARWILSDDSGFEVSDTGIAAATSGFAGVYVLRCTSAPSTLSVNAGELSFLFILQGALSVNGREQHQLREGDSIAIPPGVNATLRAETGLEMLAVNVAPAWQTAIVSQ